MKRFIPALLLLGACSSSPFDNLGHYLTTRGIEKPTAQSFSTCRGYGCQIVEIIEPTKEEWRAIENTFHPPAKSARAERKKMAASIAVFEEVVGNINGTSEDIWGTFQKTGHKQQDCVDESTNTSLYLLALKERGHIKFHSIDVPQSRVPFMKWPHQTATITEIKTGDRYAIDSWFHNNGHKPEIIPFETWKKGWKPALKSEAKNQRGEDRPAAQ